QKVRPADIARFYATLSRSGLAPGTIRLVHCVLHRALAQAKTWGVVRDNVSDNVKPPPAPDRETEMLQPEQARDLLPWPPECAATKCWRCGGEMSISIPPSSQSSSRSNKRAPMAFGSSHRRHAGDGARSRCQRAP